MDRKKNIFDKIGALIPGYSGYAERDGRRNCDKILRENICSKINIIENNIFKVIEENLDNSEIMLAFEKTRKKVNTTNSKIKFLEYGYTSFFNDSQINEEELLKIYKIDVEILNSIDELIEKNVYNDLNILNSFLKNCDDFLIKRKSFLNKYK